MKCKQCGADIIRIDTLHGKMVCNAAPVTYRRSSRPNTSILTPNGETVYCRITGRTEKMRGIGYTLHTCFQEPVTGSGIAGIMNSGDHAIQGDCLACSHSFSEPAEKAGDFDRLFCSERRKYVGEDGSCERFN